jgi:hypothetical protein
MATDWVQTTSAVGTAAAAMIALTFGVSAEWRAHRAERRNALLQEQQTEELIRRQASRVAGWLVPAINAALDNNHDESPRSRLVVRNASDEPIWDVTVFYRDDLEHPTEGTLCLIGEWQVVAPGEELEEDLDLPIGDANRRTAKFMFRDNAGRE